MYLFTRSARLARGRTRDAAAWVAEITEKVNQISETPVQLWSSMMSPTLGQLTWSTVTDDLSTLETGFDKMMADDGYVALTDKGAEFTTGDAIDDTVAQLLHFKADDTRDVRYVGAVTAQANNGHFAQAVELGIEIAQIAERASGLPTTFGTQITGPYGGVGWISGYETLEELQRGQQAVNGSTELIELLDGRAADVYLPGSGRQVMSRRVL